MTITEPFLNADDLHSLDDASNLAWRDFRSVARAVGRRNNLPWKSVVAELVGVGAQHLSATPNGGDADFDDAFRRVYDQVVPACASQSAAQVRTATSRRRWQWLRRLIPGFARLVDAIDPTIDDVDRLIDASADAQGRLEALEARLAVLAEDAIEEAEAAVRRRLDQVHAYLALVKPLTQPAVDALTALHMDGTTPAQVDDLIRAGLVYRPRPGRLELTNIGRAAINLHAQLGEPPF